jgi:hypothetical protein
MDDLAFSGDRPLGRLPGDVAKVLRRFGYRSNKSKRRSWGPGEEHLVTKIVVTTTLNPNEEFLRELFHHLLLLERGEKGLFSARELAGKVAWICQLNPVLGLQLQKRLSAAHGLKK